MTIGKLLLIGLLIGLARQSEAQVLNVEKKRAEEDSLKKWTGDAAFSFNFRQQQVRSTVFGFNSNLTRLGKQHNYSLLSDLNIVQAEEEDVVSNGFLHFRVHLNKHKKVSEELFSQVQYDEVRGMKRRTLAGAGLRSVTSLGEKSTLAFGPGVMYEHENWSFAEVDSVTRFMKSTNYLSFRYEPKKEVAVAVTAYYQARWNYFISRPRIICDVSWEFKISDHLTFESTFDIMYDSRPVVAIDKTIYGFENTIKLDF